VSPSPRGDRTRLLGTDPLETAPASRHEFWLWIVRGAGLAAGVLVVLALANVAQTAVDVIILVIVALLLAAAIDPLVDGFRGRTRLTRVQVIVLFYVLLIISATLIVVLLVPAGVSELSAFSERLPSLLEDARQAISGFGPAIVETSLTRLVNTIESSFQRSGITAADPDTLVEYGLSAADAALAVLSVLTMVFFWLISRETIQRFVLALLPHDERRGVREGWNDVESRMGYWLRGQLVLMTVVGVVATLIYLVLGLPNALLLGFFAGLMEIVPILGPAIGVIPALIVALVNGGVELVALVAIGYVVLQVVEGQVLVPMIMKRAVGLPPFVVIVSLLVGGSVAGIIGALLAVPLAAAGAAILENAQARRRTVALEAPSFGSGADETEGEVVEEEPSPS
jgi:predicted PurR-regulated permease PerM